MRRPALAYARIVPRSNTASTPSTRQRVIVAAAACVFALVSAYLALVIVSRVKGIFFPGSGLPLPGGAAVSRFLPGVDAAGSTPQNRINVLVMGVDDEYTADPRGVNRPSDGVTRTDTIEIVTIDPKTKSARVLGIPRDLWVKIPNKSDGGTFSDRVNTALVWAQVDKYPEGPVGLMKETIQNNFNINIDHYVLIDFAGFVKLIDALGGIDVDVPDEVYDPYYSETELPGDYKPQHFYPGKQHMDGSTALAYSRIRFSSDDLDRIQRQQRVIFATIAKAQSLDVLSNATTLWKQYGETIQTDFADYQIPGYAVLAKQIINANNMQAVSVGPATTPYTTPDGRDVLLGDWSRISQIVGSVFGDTTPAADASAATAEPTPAPTPALAQ